MTFEEFISEWDSGKDHIDVHTSGSTGVPKNMKLGRNFVRASALRTNSFFGITSRSRLHSCVSAEYIGGKMMAVRACEAGCLLTWETPSNHPLSEMDKDEKIDLLAVVPSQMIYIMDNIDRMPFLGAILVGGSAINPVLRRKIVYSGLNAYETYGMTEAASHIALRKIAEDCGWFVTLGGISVCLDWRGCLEIHFPTGEKLVTNDLATVRDVSTFRIDGRYDKVIITGGKKVNPFDVEQRIAHLIPSLFIVTSVPDVKWGDKVVLKIERQDNVDTTEFICNLHEKLKEVLDPWEMPKEIFIVGRLDKTPNGKLVR